MPDSTGESATREGDSCNELSDLNTYQEKSGEIKNYSAEEIEKSQPPPRRSGRVQKMPPCFPDSVMAALEEQVTY